MIRHHIDEGSPTEGEPMKDTKGASPFAKLRARRSWTQPQAADHFGFSRRTWEGWELGRRTPAGLVNLLSRMLDLEDELARLKGAEACRDLQK